MEPNPSLILRFIPRSLTAPDAWLAIILALILQYRQYARRRRLNDEQQNVLVHSTTMKPKKRLVSWSFVHEWLFTNLHMFVLPTIPENAELVVDLQSGDVDLDKLAREAASSSGLPKKKTKQTTKDSKTMMEVRSRRITKGEMMYNPYYPLVETTINLALAALVGITSRWLLGLFRSLSLSSSSSSSSSSPGGVCCSPYTGAEDVGTRTPGSFEKLLACILITKEGDDAGVMLLTMLLMILIPIVVKLALSVSALDVTTRDIDDESENIAERRDFQNAKRYFIGIGSTLMTLWFFHTPELLRTLGLAGLKEAIEELSARIILFSELAGIVHLNLGAVKNLLMTLLSIAWGYVSSNMIMPMEETAKNAAHILSPTPSNKKMDPSDMMNLINVRLMLLIGLSLTPIMIMSTYLFHTKFLDITKSSAQHGRQRRNMTFSKRHLQHSGLFVRGVLSWCFLAAVSYCLRSLIQAHLDQAANDAKSEDGTDNDATAQSKRQTKDPFNDRYKSTVSTAGRFVAFPAFVLAMLAMVHLRGGDGSAHPGVGYESQLKDSPRSMLLTKGLLPPFSDQYMSWIAKQVEPRSSDFGSSGNELLQVAALSQPSWHEHPLRDSTQTMIVDWLGDNKFCYPPEVRSIKAMGRRVNYLLGDEGDGGSLVTNQALTGLELLNMSPPVPVTFIDILLGRNPSEGSCNSEDQTSSTVHTKECRAEDAVLKSQQLPSLSQMLSFLMSHHFATPTIIFPIIDATAFLSSVWWNYWFTVKMIVHYIRFCRTPVRRDN
jgi:hypothetical protein